MRAVDIRASSILKAATTSLARSSNEAVFQSPVDPPTPRLSYPRTAMPRRIRNRAGQHVLAIFRARAVDENDCGMFSVRVRTDERPRQLNGAAREADIFTLLDVDAARGTLRGSVAPPGERAIAGAVANELDS